MNPGVNKSTTHSFFFLRTALELQGLGPSPCSLCALNFVGMQATDTASAESAFLLSGTHHFCTHTNTLTHTQPALLAVTHSTAAGTSVRPLSQFRGRRSPHRPHTLLFSFVCLSACAASFPGVCVTPFVFHSTFFFPLSPFCSQTCFSDLSPPSALQEP